MLKYQFRFLLLATCLGAAAHATILATVRGIVHDPHHRPIAGARVVLRSETSGWRQEASTNDRGEFHFDAVSVGQYGLSAEAPSFATQERQLMLTSGRDAEVHLALQPAQNRETVEVSGTALEVNPESSAASGLVSREQIAQTPGADQANSLAMIANYVPGATIVHNQLHVRGGHQTTWLLDGVPVPNTNIASNVGPQFDPKDIDYLETQRGGFSAEYGDRAYSVFNVVTRSGFERNRQGELVASFGNFYTTNSQLSFGDHTQNFAWYGSVSGNRSDLGLEPPTREILHNRSAGLSGFGSLIYNRGPQDQLRLTTSIRGDHYQIPNTPEQQSCADPAAECLRDVENERDAFVNVSWLHTASRGIVLTVAPFFHFNRAHYLGGNADRPIVTEDDRGSNYAGGVVNLGITRGRHNARFGVQSFWQRDNQLFGITTADGSNPPIRERDVVTGSLSSLYLEDQYKPLSWLTLNGGVRLSRFAGAPTKSLSAGVTTVTENVADPRIGAAVQLPRLNWVLRGFWGRYYQAPPLLSISGPLLEQAAEDGFDVIPLRGERDQQLNAGITIPLHGWVLDADWFRTNAKNYFDHDAVLNSNIFIPLTIANARIKGTEVALHSPEIARRVRVGLAYSRQYVQGRGGVTGGLTDFTPPDDGFYFLDHDQRDTLSINAQARMPWRAWVSSNVSYGSGFLDGEGPEHLPAHTTFDLSIGKSFAENWSVTLTGLNVLNRRFQFDNSNTFGGTHWNLPRQLYIQVKYRFRL